jgi:SNF2 family DNA or RNA helicase
VVVVAYITYLVSKAKEVTCSYLANSVPQWLKTQKEKVVLIHAKTPNRFFITDGFQEAEHSDHIEKQLYKDAKAATILVSTPELLGTGLTLTRAFRVVLMEPAWMLRTEEQAFSRVQRIGQKNDKTYTYRYLARDNKEEGDIIKRQGGRSELNVQSYDIGLDIDTVMGGL